ncbi:MAG TPA: TRAP transporter fused permease subunit [Bacillota bacterium]|nr:TRAP transporter fused permease subunit [Bacillota bacterium]
MGARKWSDPKNIIAFLCTACSLIYLYTAGFGLFSTINQRAILLALLAPVVFLSVTSEEKDDTLVTKSLNIWNIIFGLAVIVVNVYLMSTWQDKIFKTGEIQMMDVVMGTILILVILEATRQATGLFLSMTAVVCMVYALFGPYFPSFLAHRGETWDRLVDFLFVSTDGIFGTALGIAATYIIIFVIFGAFLEAFGGGKFFIDIAYAIAGRFRGGPAKTAVFASALLGMISGAPAANVATGGVFTIPLMKLVGYKPHVAAAIEAVASTGGIFTPPIMGAGAFIMAEYLGLPYAQVCLAALMPCILYYLALILLVDAQAVNNGLKGLPAKELPSIKQALKERGLLGLPILFLLAVIIIGWNPMKSAFWATILTVVVGMFNKNTRPKLKDIFAALEKGSRQIVPIVVTCAAAGIIDGVFSLTGLGAKLSYSLNALQGSAGSVLMAGFVTAIIALLLGAALPPTAVYLIMVPTVIPAIIPLGIHPIAAHMFVFIFAAVGALTPPVAITAYTAAAIAKSDPNETAWLSCRYGIVAYLVPFMFIISPALLFVGNISLTVLAIVTSIIGVFCLSAVIEGYVFISWSKWARIILLPASLLMFVPMMKLNLIGVVLIIASYIVNQFTMKQELKVAG